MFWIPEVENKMNNKVISQKLEQHVKQHLSRPFLISSIIGILTFIKSRFR